MIVIDISHITQNWQSTVQSILTTTFAVTGVLMVSSVISPHTAAILVTINGICKVSLGVFQKDGGAQLPSGTVIKTSVTTPKE